jgi:hypothetical protein
MTLSLQVTVKDLTFLNFLLMANKIHSVFPKWRECFLSMSHSLQDCSSSPNLLAIRSRFLQENDSTIIRKQSLLILIDTSFT